MFEQNLTIIFINSKVVFIFTRLLSISTNKIFLFINSLILKGSEVFKFKEKTQMKKGVMRFFLSPFIFVFELIAFLIQAAVLYGLALIAVFGLIAYGISTMPKTEYIHTTETVTVVETVEVEVSKTPELICKRLSGCETFSDAKTEEEYCPTCVWDK